MIALPYLVFLGDADRTFGAKTGQGVAFWRPDQCVGQKSMPGCTVDLGLPELDYAAAVEAGAKTLLIGIAASGGRIKPNWIPELVNALEAGLDIASGQHQRLASFPEIKAAAEACGRVLHDVRHFRGELPIGTGEKRPGKRVLMVGTDCAVGKKFTALAVEAEMKARGLNATFRATGQTGVLIAGEGVAIDAVPADFISGAVEMLAPANTPDHWDVIEGQASVLHPSFAGVTTGLVHGAQPDVLIICHEAGRTTVRGLEPRPLPSLTRTIEAHLNIARETNSAVRAAALSVNTKGFDEAAARAALSAAAAETGLPATDPVRFGAGVLVDAILASQERAA
ncbi:MAG: DUF1611 domain-containing protein [Oceanicaulis sp.]